MAWISVNSIGYELGKDICFMFIGAAVGIYLSAGPLRADYERDLIDNYQQRTKQIYDLCRDKLENKEKVEVLEDIVYPDQKK
ncbi:MAG: hypothetical protein ACQER9_03195 [Nanobdellota archaeon]